MNNPFDNKNKAVVNSDTENTDELRRFLFILIQTKFLVITFIIVGFLTSYFFSKSLRDIFESKVIIKIDKPQGNVLDEFRMQEFGQQKAYIENQISILKSYVVRELAAKSLIDSIKKDKDYSHYSLLLKSANENDTTLIDELTLREKLTRIVEINNPKGLDNIEVSVKGRVFYENRLIASTVANSYIQYNLDISRAQLTSVRKLLEDERKKKFVELSDVEGQLEDYQKKTGIVNIDQSLENLVSNSSQIEALKNSTEIDLRIAETNLQQVTDEFKKLDPSVDSYVNSKINQPYFDKILEQIADIEVKKEIELTGVTNPKIIEKINSDADKKEAALRKDYDNQLQILRESVNSPSVSVRSDLYNSLIKAKIELKSLKSKQGAIAKISKMYDNEMSVLPSNVIEYAKLERNRTSAEKLYTTLEGKYQEALINERSRLGNAYIIDPGGDNYGPIGPNRVRLTVIGTSVSFILALLFVFLKDKLDKTIKTPEELESNGVSVLSWIPDIDPLDLQDSKTKEFVMGQHGKSSVSEAFKALRTRIQYSTLEDKPLKSILVTSSIPSEGKTTVSVNLAGSFALTGKKTLILDCDLRKPRVHSIFNLDKYPGLSDYLFSNCTLEEITKPTGLENLYVIPAGTIPPNPSEMLGSVKMKKFIEKLEEIYDIVLFDSPPFLSVTDAEILYNITDGAILIAQANKSIKRAFYTAYNRLKAQENNNLLGVVLNNFKLNSSYGYYYQYYYYYYRDDKNTPNSKKKANNSNLNSSPNNS